MNERERESESKRPYGQMSMHHNAPWRRPLPVSVANTTDRHVERKGKYTSERKGKGHFERKGKGTSERKGKDTSERKGHF